MKTTIKHENDNFLVIPLKHVSGLTVVVNHPGTPKIWSITHGNDHKSKKDDIFIIPLKYVNRPGTQKLWSITHGNDHKNKKRQHFLHTSQIYKSPWNPNTIGDYSCRRSENTKMTS